MNTWIFGIFVLALFAMTTKSEHVNQTLKTLCGNVYNCIIQCQGKLVVLGYCAYTLPTINPMTGSGIICYCCFTHMHFRTAPCFACRNSWMSFYSSLQSHDSWLLLMRARKKPSFMHLALAKTTKSEKKYSYVLCTAGEYHILRLLLNVANTIYAETFRASTRTDLTPTSNTDYKRSRLTGYQLPDFAGCCESRNIGTCNETQSGSNVVSHRKLYSDDAGVTINCSFPV